MGHLGGGGHALDGQAEVVDRFVGLAGEVLDRAARQPDGGRPGHRGGHAPGVAGKGIFQVGGHRKMGGGDHGGGVAEGLLGGHRPVEAAQGGGEPAAGGGQCL